MTPDDVIERVDAIKKISWDDETAHLMEDGLRADVLSEIANGSSFAVELAREALRSSDIEFSRWCA